MNVPNWIGLALIIIGSIIVIADDKTSGGQRAFGVVCSLIVTGLLLWR